MTDVAHALNTEVARHDKQQHIHAQDIAVEPVVVFSIIEKKINSNIHADHNRQPK